MLQPRTPASSKPGDGVGVRVGASPDTVSLDLRHPACERMHSHRPGHSSVQQRIQAAQEVDTGAVETGAPRPAQPRGPACRRPVLLGLAF